MALEKSHGSPDAVWDTQDSSEETAYECLACGWRTTGESNPGACPDCNEALRNCGMPME